jgi:hypothetical protein
MNSGHDKVTQSEGGKWCTCEKDPPIPRGEGHERRDYWTNSYPGGHGHHQPWTPFGKFQMDYDESKRVQPDIDEPGDFQTDYKEALRMDQQFTVGNGPKALIRLVGKEAGYIAVVDVTTGRPYNIPLDHFVNGLRAKKIKPI